MPWPNSGSAGLASAGDQTVADDLRAKDIAHAISIHGYYLRPIHNLLSTLMTDEETLRYRLDAFEDCQANATLSDGLCLPLPQQRNLDNTERDICTRRNRVSLVRFR